MKYDQIAEAYIHAVLENTSDIPCVDISHHKTPEKTDISESMNSWINDDPENYHRQHSFRQGIRYYDLPDKYSHIAMEHTEELGYRHHLHDAIRNYVTGGLNSGDTGSREVNMHLIESHKNKTQPKPYFSFDDGDGGSVELVLAHLDDALKQNKLKEQLITYSGIGFNPAKLMQNNKLHLPAYTSSTTNRSVSLLYAAPDHDGNRHVLQIKHPKGATGFYIGDNDAYSPFGQKEHIMPRGVTLNIDPTPEIHEDSDGVKLHIWKANRLISTEK